MILGLIQSSGHCRLDNKFKKLLDKVKRAANRGAHVIVLPELFLDAYFCQTKNAVHFDLALTHQSREIITLQKLSQDLSIVLVVPFFEIDSQKYFNSCAVYDSGRLLGTYRKIHLPDDPGFHEKYYFSGGDTGYKVYPTKSGNLHGYSPVFSEFFQRGLRQKNYPRKLSCFQYPLD